MGNLEAQSTATVKCVFMLDLTSYYIQVLHCSKFCFNSIKDGSRLSSKQLGLLYHTQLGTCCITNKWAPAVSQTIGYLLYHRHMGTCCITHNWAPAVSKNWAPAVSQAIGHLLITNNWAPAYHKQLGTCCITNIWVPAVSHTIGQYHTQLGTCCITHNWARAYHKQLGNCCITILLM